MSKVIGKCMAITASAAEKVKTSWSNSKQDGKVLDLEKRIAVLTAEIGNLTVLDLDKGAQASEAVTERYNEIVSARKAIEEAENNKTVTTVVCPKCGAKTTVGMHYCSKCGEKIAPLSRFSAK